MVDAPLHELSPYRFEVSFLGRILKASGASEVIFSFEALLRSNSSMPYYPG